MEQKLPTVEPGHTPGVGTSLPREEHKDVSDAIGHSEYPKFVLCATRGLVKVYNEAEEAVLDVAKKAEEAVNEPEPAKIAEAIAAVPVVATPVPPEPEEEPDTVIIPAPEVEASSPPESMIVSEPEPEVVDAPASVENQPSSE